MAAYAALVSLEHIINNLQLHPRPPISLHKQQAYLLTEKATFLQEFLEFYNPNLPYSKEADPLETRIARAAYAAEDAIESHILDHFTNNNNREKMSSASLFEALEEVIEDMALIEKDAMEIKETGRFQDQLHANSMTLVDSSGSTSSSSIVQKKSMMVGVDDLLLEMKSKLTASARDQQIIPIVGMGGSGKTTLALNIYQDNLITEHFDIRAWVTISQEYSIPEILKQLLIQLNQDSSVGELGEMLHKHLYGRRFMIILDDMWSLKAWDGVKSFFPNNNNGSRVVITTRQKTLASVMPNSSSLVMKLLDEDASWDLLSKTVFGEKGCPLGFEDIGKKIGKSCKGLPLSIVVVGGLLAKSEQSIKSWKQIEENLNAIVNLEDDERCFKTLYMSYKQLSVHLKPCFLYMGIYREDHMICISRLVKLWVAEGFIKPVCGRRPEDVAREYIKDLTDRNLIMIHEVGSIGSIKYCKVHDLLRDFCLREAQKEGFYTIYPGHEIGMRLSRIVMSSTLPKLEEIDALSSATLARFLFVDLDNEDLPSHILRLLRIVGSNIASDKLLDNVHQLVNSRLFTYHVEDPHIVTDEFPSIIYRLFWNLQIFVVTDEFEDEGFTAPADIWNMSHIRHLHFENLYLPDPPSFKEGIVLANLQSLGWIKDFTCSEQLVKRIPNVRKLKLLYEEDGVDDRFCLTNLDCLDKLETLKCCLYGSICLINFPKSLKKLSLRVHQSQCWQDILDKIGALPLLQKLKLRDGTFQAQWETTEGQFCSLKFLSICMCEGLQVWTSEASHFPTLEQLHLRGLDDLNEIPSDFAEIPTLGLIEIDGCSDSAVESAKRILEEQEALYGEEETTLQIHVDLWSSNNPALESLRSHNFHVTP